MPIPIIAIRCKEVGPIEAALRQELLAAGARHVVFAENSDPPGHPDSVPVTTAGLARMGLTGLPGDWAWRYGDMCLYAMLDRFPEASRFLLIENDVAFAPGAAQQFLDYCRETEAEAAAARLRRYPQAPRFSRQLAALERDDSVGCIFPVVLADRGVVQRMFELRRTCLNAGLIRLNDEAVFASVALDGSRSASLEVELPGLFGPTTFETNPPHLRTAVADHPQPAIFHPALPMQTILDRISSGNRGYGRHRLRRVLTQATSDQRDELLTCLSRIEAAQ